ncbi:TetR/AcrR family transcriptional regulator [Hyphomonas sp.]|uniref:TetR/AcrR family transcriptional regulator n=1 Tax=Hyphomonas sp. TaxID=87 RepID=UPI003529B5A6
MNIREDFVRPRSDRENAARRAAILEAAEKLMLESHNQRFSISNVAQRLGVSQSTIFLHFRNREELLTTLYTQVGKNFFETFLGRLHEGMSDRAFSEAFIDTAIEFPGFRLMRPMIMRVVEESLNQDYIHDAVKEIYLYRTAAADHVEELLKLGAGDGRRVMKSFVNLMCGAVQADIGKLLATEKMDEEVADGVRSFDFREAFLSGAELLMIGIRKSSNHDCS